MFTEKTRGEKRMAVQNQKPYANKGRIDEIGDKEQKGGGGKRFLKGLLIFILIIGAAAFAMYYAYNHFMGGSTAQYESSIAEINSRVDDANAKVAEVLKGSVDLPADEIKKILPTTYDAFNEISKDLSDIPAPSAFSASHNKLVEAVKLNKLIYQQLGDILRNPINQDMEKTINAMNQNIEECVNNYIAVDIKSSNFRLPDEVQNMTSKVNLWVKQKQSEYARVSELMASFSKYFNSMSALIVDYEGSRVDINTELNAARADRASWDKPLLLIEENEEKVKIVKANYESLKVPSQLKAFNKEFAPILDDTLLYYSKLRLAIQTDMGFNKEGLTEEQINAKTAEIQALYQDADASYSSANTNYQKYTANFAVQKDKFNDPEYVMTLMK